MPVSRPSRTVGGSWRVARRDQGTRTLYRLMRWVVQGFAVFLLVIVGVVAWRKLIIEARAVTSLEYGEYVSLGLLLAIAAALWALAGWIAREARKP